MEEGKIKWGFQISNSGAFLLGATINIGKGHYYLCIYIGFKTLSIGKDYFWK